MFQKKKKQSIKHILMQFIQEAVPLQGKPRDAAIDFDT